MAASDSKEYAEHYSSVWGRDNAITGLGAIASGNDALIECTGRGCLTLAEHASELGQIPNAYWPALKYQDWGEADATDATPWNVIASSSYYLATGDETFRKKISSHVVNNMTWLRYQDKNNIGLIDSQGAGDWMDSSLRRSGKLLYNNVLYYLSLHAAANLLPERAEDYIPRSEKLKQMINGLMWPDPEVKLSDVLGISQKVLNDNAVMHVASENAYKKAQDESRMHYTSHQTFGHIVDRCDVLGNMLAILAGVADKEKATKIFKYLDLQNITSPYPVRVWPAPFLENDGTGVFDPIADAAQGTLWRNKPYEYHNGAVWMFVGGFFVAAEALNGRFQRAKADYPKLIEGAKDEAQDGKFTCNEWRHGETGTVGGAENQAWSAAGGFIADAGLQGIHPFPFLQN
jgi:glycogen debranching enzyme